MAQETLAQEILPKQRSLSWIWGLGLLMVVGGGSWWAYGRWFGASSTAVRVQVSPVTQGTVEDPITQTGTIKLAQQRTLDALREGRVKEMFVEVGDLVATGQTLLILQDDGLATERLQYSLNVQKQEITLTQRKQEIASAEAQLQDANKELAKETNLFERGYVSEEDVEQRQQGVRRANAELQDAHLLLERELLTAQELQIKEQELEQRELRQQVLAPGPAIILDLLVQTGSVVQTGDKLMVLGNPGSELVYLQLSPLRAEQVRPLQSARVRPLGPNAETYTGQVKELALLAGSGEDKSTRSGGQSDLEVVVELDAPSGTMIPGTQVSVDIVLDQREDVVKVDAGAIQQSEEGPFVWIVDENSTAKKQPISIGLEGLTEFEITEGLVTGDRVIILPESPLEDGMVVEVDDPGENAPQGLSSILAPLTVGNPVTMRT